MGSGNEAWVGAVPQNCTPTATTTYYTHSHQALKALQPPSSAGWQNVWKLPTPSSRPDCSKNINVTPTSQATRKLQQTAAASSYLDERVWKLQQIVVGQPQLAQRALERWAKHLVPQGLKAIVRQLQTSKPEGAKPERKMRQHVPVRVKCLTIEQRLVQFRVQFIRRGERRGEEIAPNIVFCVSLVHADR